MDNKKRIYQEHERIGFPLISESDQANILIWRDVEIINRLTPGFKADFIPAEVARMYIRLSKDRFKELFINSGYIEKLYETHLKFPDRDGLWVEKTEGSKYELKFQERGALSHIEHFADYSEVVEYFVNSMYKSFRFFGEPDVQKLIIYP
jgi:hypothetical protein